MCVCLLACVHVGACMSMCVCVCGGGGGRGGVCVTENNTKTGWLVETCQLAFITPPHSQCDQTQTRHAVKGHLKKNVQPQKACVSITFIRQLPWNIPRYTVTAPTTSRNGGGLLEYWYKIWMGTIFAPPVCVKESLC